MGYFYEDHEIKGAAALRSVENGGIAAVVPAYKVHELGGIARDAGLSVEGFRDLLVNFRIADTFTDSLARLTGDEQKAVKTTAFDLQINPASPGLSFHKLDKARDRNFWSVRVGSDIRLIVHRTDASLLLCYVDHHD